jgi:hypothetical protein
MLTNSRFRAFRECPRKEYLSYDCALEPAVPPARFSRGLAFHAAMASEPYSTDPHTAAVVERVATQFREREAQYVTVTQREVPFEVQVDGWDETLGGFIDAIGVLHDGRLAVVERKTTTDPEGLMAALDVDSQVLTYYVGARAQGIDVRAVLYAVQPWPGERPLKATPPEKRRYTREGKLYANQREADETPDEFAARVTLHEPIFREVGILHDAVDDHLRDLDAQYRTRAWMRANARPYRNPQSCADCAFVSVCRSQITPETQPPSGFVRRTTTR